MATASLELGQAYHQRGDLALAAQHYRAALAQVPGHAVALNMLGVVALQRNDLATGTELLRQAIAQQPNFAGAHLNLGNAMRLLQRPAEALVCYDRAIALQPDSADAYSNRGVALAELARFDEAAASYQQALDLAPHHPNARFNLGNVLAALGRHTEALASYDQALVHQPNHPQLHKNRGITLQNLERPQEALASFELALHIAPDDIGLVSNRADLLRTLKRHQDALDGYRHLLALQADYPYALGDKLQTQLHICDWTDLNRTLQQVIAAVAHGQPAITPSYFMASSDCAASQLQCAQNYIARQHPAASQPVWRGERYTHERIRLAYLSADFHNHATAYLMAELFELHDKTRFELVAVSFSPDTQGGMRARLEQALGTLVDVQHLSDAQVAGLLRQLEFDIVVDLKGFTQGSRTGIFAYRAAPVQVSYLGYPGSSGAPYMDYLIADAHVIPEGHERFYSEKVVRLPGSYQVNDRQRVIAADTPSRAQSQLPETGFVFCSFNNNYKITPVVFGIWMRLLHQVAGSVLWLLEDNASASVNLQREAAQRGIAPQRLVFAPRLPLAEHLARHRVADLFLDTLPVNAHTTASDALWAGLPIVTCTGDAFASRVAASLLHAVGLPELVTHTLADYEALALKLTSTPTLLSGFKNRLHCNRLTQPLFDTPRFCQHIESAYSTMHERCQQGLTPAAFAVAARCSGNAVVD